MRWPVAKPAYVSHEMVHAAVLMLPEESPNGFVKIERCAHGSRRDHDTDQPIQNGGVLHKCVPVTSTGRYFEDAGEIPQP